MLPIADGINRAIAANPSEVFLIEGHTDAVGSDIDNLSLSDRRAESVALVLSQQFGLLPENLTTQGYGAYYLKIHLQPMLLVIAQKNVEQSENNQQRG